MTADAARSGALDLAVAAGDRPAPPRPSDTVVTPSASAAAPAVPTARIPPEAILELAAVTAGASKPRPFGQLVSRARGVLGRSAVLAAAAAAGAGTRARKWRGLRFRATATIAPVTVAPAVAVEAPAAPQVVPRRRRSWREQRWERRRKRRMAEEVLGWILVPIILISIGWGMKAGLNALGTTPTALIQGFKAALSGKS